MMWKKIKEAVYSYKGLTYIGFANIFSSIVLAVLWLAIARVVTVEDYGFLSFSIAIATIAGAVALPGVTNTILTYGGKDSKIISPIFSISIIFLIVSSIVIYFIYQNFAISVYVIAYPLFGLIATKFLSRKSYSNYSKIIISQGITSVILSILFYFLIGIDGIILGLAFSFFIYFYKLYHILKENPFQISVLKKYRSFMIDNYGVDIARILSLQMDKLLIFPIFGYLILGNYYLAFQFVSIATIIPFTVWQYMLPLESKTKSFRNLKIITIIFASLLTGLIIIIAPIALPILFPNYSDSVIMVQVMILSVVPTTMNFMYRSKFLSRGQSKIVFIGSLFFIITQIISIVILGQLSVTYGIAIALVLANLVEFCYLTLQNRRLEIIDQ